jgi:hypothetical protein
MDGFTFVIQRDEVTRHRFISMMRWNQIVECALVAGNSPTRIVEVRTRGRVLEHRHRLPIVGRDVLIAAALEEPKFLSQDFQQISAITWHASSGGDFSGT